MELTCPKCRGSMRSYERVGIVIDQCSECRGVYLDRGELEKLIDAEAGQAEAAGAASTGGPAWGTPEPRRGEHRYRGERDDDDHRAYGYGGDRYQPYGYDGGRYDDDDRYGDPRYRKKRRKSFLEELFD